MTAALSLVPSEATTATTVAGAEPAATRPRDRAARDALIKEHLGLVHTIALDVHRHLARFVAKDDLIGYGNIGLVEAATRFEAAGNPGRLPFSVYARYRIRGAMFDGIRHQGACQDGLTYPKEAYQRIAAQARVNQILEHEALTRYGDVTSPAEAVAWVDDVLTRIARAHSLSLVEGDESDPDWAPEQSASDGNSWNGVPLATMPEPPPVDAALAREALAILTPKQRRLVELVYSHDMDINEAARELGIGSGTASKLHARALAALRAVVTPEVVR